MRHLIVWTKSIFDQINITLISLRLVRFHPHNLFYNHTSHLILQNSISKVLHPTILWGGRRSISHINLFFSTFMQFLDASKRNTGKGTKLFNTHITDILIPIMQYLWTKSILVINPMSQNLLLENSWGMPIQIPSII